MDKLISRLRWGLVKGLNRRWIVGDGMRVDRRGVVGDDMRCVLCIDNGLGLGIQIGRLSYRRLWERL